jgi:hypothetical protein
MAGFRHLGALVCLLALLGCAGNAPDRPEKARFEADYASYWADREELYREGSSPRSRGALGALSAFRETRPENAPYRELEIWLRRRHAAHRARLLKAGLTDEKINALIAGNAENGSAAGERSVDYNIGALAETRRLYGEVARMKSGTPPEDEAGAGALQPPVIPGAYQPLVRGVLSGVGNVLGF